MDCNSSVSDAVACPTCYTTSSPHYHFNNIKDGVFLKMMCNDANCLQSFIWCTVCSSSLRRISHEHEKSKKHVVNLGKVNGKLTFDEIIFEDEPSPNLPGAIHNDTIENDEFFFDDMECCEPSTDHERTAVNNTLTKSIKHLLIEQKTNLDAPASSMHTFFHDEMVQPLLGVKVLVARSKIGRFSDEERASFVAQSLHDIDARCMFRYALFARSLTMP